MPALAEELKQMEPKRRRYYNENSVINKRYIIQSIVGEGGMGVVYKALDNLKGNAVIALKTIRPEIINNRDVLRVFKKEFEIMTKLKHPNLVDVYLFGYDKENACYYITMEYLSGSSLKSIISKQDKMDSNKSLDIIVELLRGLEFIHSRDIIYRDIKPSNIIICNGRAKFMDFGISDIGAVDHSKVKGSISYIAPEVLLKSGDYRIDIYSLGIVFLEMLTKRTIYSETASISQILDILSDHAQFIKIQKRALKEIIPEELCSIVSKMTAYDPDRRYKSCMHIISDINEKLGFSYSLETDETKDAYVLGVSFTDRKKELGIIRERIHSDEGKSSIFLLVSNQGMGKSMVYKEIKKYCMLENIYFFESDCSKDVKSPFYTVNQIIMQLIQFISPALEDKYRKYIEKLGIYSASTASEYDYARDSRSSYEILLQSIVNLLLESGSQLDNKALIYINNLQWADKQSLEIIIKILYVLRSQRNSLKLFASARNEDLSLIEDKISELESMNAISILGLRPFNKRDIKEYFNNVFGKNRIERSIKANISEFSNISGGNPLFLSEFIKFAIKSGIIDRKMEGWGQNVDVREIRLPENIGDITINRVNYFLERGNFGFFLGIFAVIRIPLSFNDICMLFDKFSRDYAGKMIFELEKYELISSERVSEIHELKIMYRIANTIIRDIIINNMKNSREYHKYVASRFERIFSNNLDRYADEIAYHYDCASDAGKAVFYLIRSANFIKNRSKDADIVLNRLNRALSLSNEYHGAESEETSKVLEIMGGVFFDESRFTASLDCYDKAISIIKRNSGIYNSRYVKLIVDKAYVYLQAGQYSKVFSYLDEAMSIEQKQKSPGNTEGQKPRILMFLGDVFFAKGDYSRAKNYFDQSLAIFENIHGEDSLEVTAPLNCLGNVYFLCGEFETALDYYSRAFEIKRRHSGRNNIELCSYYINIATVLLHKGRYDDSLRYFKKVLRIQRTFYKRFNLNIAKALNNIGVLYYKTKNYDKALRYYNKSLSMRREIYGEDHEQTADSYMNIGLIHFEKDQYEKALWYYNRALKIYISFFGNNNLRVSYCLNSIGYIFNSKGDYDRAVDSFQKALEIRRRLFDGNHHSIGESYDSIGDAYFGKREFLNAVKFYKKAFKTLSAALGKDHPNIAISLSNLASAYEEMEENQKALSCLKEALRINELKFGKKHKVTLHTAEKLIGILSKINKAAEISYYLDEYDLKRDEP